MLDNMYTELTRKIILYEEITYVYGKALVNSELTWKIILYGKIIYVNGKALMIIA